MSRKKCFIEFFICMELFFLTGCSKDIRMSNDMKNVEDRDYATILMIEEDEEKSGYHFVLGVAQEKVVGEKSMVENVSEWEADGMEELANVYSNVMGKDLSLAHLKVILFEDAAENRVWQERLLYLLDKEDEVAKTCPVLEVKDLEEIDRFLREEEEPVGNYLENLVRITERQGVDVPWLKDYLNAIRENRNIRIMYLEPVEEGWEIIY